MTTTVNILFVMESATALLLKDNFYRDENGQRLRTDLTDEQIENVSGIEHEYWLRPVVDTVEYTTISLYVPPLTVSRSDPLLQWFKWLEDLWPGKTDIVGVWNYDGSQYGTTLTLATYDEEGREVTPEQIDGTPVYQINPWVLSNPDKFFPLKRGSRRGRTALAPWEVNNMFGWSPRRWS